MIMSIKCCSSLLLFILGFGEAISQWGGIPLTQRIQSDNNRVLQYHQEQMRLAGINHPGSVLAENVAIPVAPLQYRDFVTIENTPNKVKANHTLNIKYQCSQPFTIVLFMDGNYLQLNKPNINKSISIYKDSDIIFFRKFWQCERSPRESKVQILLIFPPELLRPPNLMLQKVWTMQSVNLKIAMVDKALWTYLENAEYLLRDTYHIAFEKSHKSMVLPLKFEHPYCRSEDEFGRCFHWPYAMINEVFLKQPPKSPHDSVVTHLLKHPIVSSETHVGIPRNFYRFMNSEMRQRNKYKEPRYTFSMVFYLASACEKLCAVLQHIGDDGHYTTPIVFINDKSQIHVQGQVADNQSYAFYSDWTVPLNEWIRLDIQQYSVMLNVTMKHGKNFTETSSVMKSFHLPMIQDYESGFFTVGSSMYARNFRGIIGSATLWRSMVLTSEEIPVPTPDEAMFQLGIEDMLIKSKKVMTMINQRWEFLLSHKINETRKANSDICLPYFVEIIRPVKERSLEKCPLESEPLPKSLSLIEAELVKLSKKRRKASINVQLELGERLYNKALRLIDGTDTIMKMNSIIKVLENAAMLNHGEACSLLYVIYANGFGTNIDNEKARKYLHLGGMLGDRISIKILAHKHLNGEDDFKKDEEIAFYYYYNAAQAAQTDRQQHVESMTDVNRVRLTDEKRLKHQTSEDEDLFQWLKHQAGTGMKEAKRNLGQLLYWGKQGLKRNLKAAFEYYEQAAQDTDDPSALYDYGITLMKGHGTDVDEDKGLEVLLKAAEKNSSRAFNTLGWYYIRQEGAENKKKAVEYFERSNELNNVDAAYNLGHMHQIGDYPGEKRNMKKAFELFYKAAARGHVESAVRISYLMACGIRDFVHRGIQSACFWAKPVSEMSPVMGEIIREALQAFRSQSWTKSTLLYLVAAETGFEPAQYNTAFLVDEDQSKLIRKNVGRDCIWRFYNASAHHYDPPPYALNKMGDYYYYGHSGKQDLEKAIQYYVVATKMRDPQAIFNMAFILEKHGDSVSNDTLKLLGLPDKVLKRREDTIVELYQICSDLGSEENSMPCYMGLIRMKALVMWKYSSFLTKVAVTVIVIIASSLLIFASTFLRHQRHTDNLVLTEQGTVEDGDVTIRTRLLQEEIIEHETCRKVSKIKDIEDFDDDESRLRRKSNKETTVVENGGSELICTEVGEADSVTQSNETLIKRGKCALEESSEDENEEQDVSVLTVKDQSKGNGDLLEPIVEDIGTCTQDDAESRDNKKDQ